MTQDIFLDRELHDLLFTDKLSQKIARPILWTEYRRDAEYNRLPCPACNTKYGYKEGQYGCPYCKGLGYLWDERIIEGYIYRRGATSGSNGNYAMNSLAGRADNSSFVLITTKEVRPRIADKISILDLQPDGKITVPLVKDTEMVVTYDRNFKASHIGTDFNYCMLGG